MTSLPPVKQFVSASGPRVYRIACSVFPNLSGRVYLVLDAGPPTLVDAGAVHGQSVRDLLAGFDAIRREFQMPVALADVKRIVITHGHLDHIGGLAEIVARTGAEVVVHPLDSRIIAAYDERAAVVRYRTDRFLRQAGLAPQRRADLLQAFGYFPGRLRNVAVDRLIDDGEQLDGLHFLHTPGHSPGHLCIGVGEILLAGDHILARTVSQQWPESLAASTGLGHYLDSLEKVEARGFELVLGGHEPPIHDVGKRINEIRSSHRRRLDRVVEILRNSPEPLSLGEIAQQMYAQPDGLAAILAITDAGSRIEYLEQRGVVAIANFADLEIDREPIFRYQLP